MKGKSESKITLMQQIIIPSHIHAIYNIQSHCLTKKQENKKLIKILILQQTYKKRPENIQLTPSRIMLFLYTVLHIYIIKRTSWITFQPFINTGFVENMITGQFPGNLPDLYIMETYWAFMMIVLLNQKRLEKFTNQIFTLFTFQNLKELITLSSSPTSIELIIWNLFSIFTWCLCSMWRV